VRATARRRMSLLFAMIALVHATSAFPARASPTEGSSTDPARAAVERVVADYIGLYAGPTIDRWRTLFHPAVVVAFPDEDGSIRTRTLDEFVTRQENYFATGRRISERLENVRIDMGRRIARVSADFIFIDQGEERPGKLGLHLAEGQDGWRIVAVLFAYDAA
jgi:Putative lumazine-binding